MTRRSLSMTLATLALLLFCGQPVFAHCGKCGMGDEKGPHHMEQMKQKHGGCCDKKQKRHDCSNCEMHGKEHQHGNLKCADCEKEGHHGHHGRHEHSDDGGKLDELFEKDKS